MSTRCQIRFVFPDGHVLTYQHSDGYPTYAIPNMIEFLKWNKGRNAQYDYVIPNWFYWNKKSMEQYCDKKYDDNYKPLVIDAKDSYSYAQNYNKPEYANDHNLYVKIGYGLDYHGTLHGDIEYFYDITFTENIGENDNSRRFLSGDIEDNISFTIEAYVPNYDWDKHGMRYNNPESLLKNRDPFYTLQIASLDNVGDISKELELAEKKASRISNREYNAWKAKQKVVA